MSTLVMKFGGSTVGTASVLTQMLSIVLHESKQWDNMIVVVSALDGVTDALIEAAHLAKLNNNRGYRRIAATLRTRHMALVDNLPLSEEERNTLQADIDRLLFDMLNIYQDIASSVDDAINAEQLDSVIGIGEKISSRIIATLLRQKDLRGVAIDTNEIIITDDIFGNANPDQGATQQRVDRVLLPMLDRKIIPVLTGYIGSTPDGRITTLGRGGSDYTASTLAVCTNADEVWMWTDVDGIMSADPDEVPDASVIAELSYEEMAELAYFGARVLHPRMVAPLKDNNIPIKIKNVFKPQQAGTKVHSSPKSKRRIKAVTSIQGIGLATNRSGSLRQITKHADEVLFTTTGVRADVMIASQSSTHSFLCFVIPTNAGPDMTNIVLSALQQRLEEENIAPDWELMPVAIVTSIGSEINGSPVYIARIMEKLGEMRLLALAQGPSWCSLSLVIEPHNVENALHQIHTLTANSG